jgi:hypothetical protein
LHEGVERCKRSLRATSDEELAFDCADGVLLLSDLDELGWMLALEPSQETALPLEQALQGCGRLRFQDFDGFGSGHSFWSAIAFHNRRLISTG